MKRRTFIETTGKGSLLLLGLPALRCKGSKGSNNIAVETMTSGPLQHFFGYFGMNPWNQSENLMLALETGSQERFPEPGEKALIGLVDVRTKKFEGITQTSTWNFQQGAMLNWNPLNPDEDIFFNDMIDGRMVTRKLNIRNGRQSFIPRPVNALSHDGKYALSLDYGRLGRLRKVVGYSGVEDPNPNDPHPENDGVFLVDMQTGDTKLIVSIDEVYDLLRQRGLDLGDDHMWFNHVVFNKSDTRILFLARTRKIAGGLQTGMFTVNIDGTDLFEAIPYGTGVSHFDWRNDTEIIATFEAVAGEGMKHFLFKDKIRDYTAIGEGNLDFDGHCVFGPDPDWFATDRKVRTETVFRQYLYVYNVETKEFMQPAIACRQFQITNLIIFQMNTLMNIDSMYRRFLIAGFATLFFVFGACDKKGTDPPNIVFVFADDLGWADVGYNGQSFYETPNIDRLSEEGMVFNRFYPGAANCAPSRACLLTGMYTPRHGVYVPQGLSRNGDISKMKYKTPTDGADSSFFNFHVSINNVEAEYESLAEMLSRAGYTSARFGKWHIGDDNQGFDVSSANGEPGFITNLKGDEKRFYDDTLVAQKLTGAGIDFITGNRDRPFFLYLAHWEVHGPMAATQDRIDYFREKKEKNGGRGLSPVYAAEVEQLDLCVGRIVAHLEDLGLAENTILIFTSDNGGSIPSTTNIPLRAGKGTFYEGGIRTPFCIKWPGVIEPGQVSDVPISGVDMMPTFAELASVPVPENQPVDGRSIIPLLSNQTFDTNRSMFFHFPLYLGGGKEGIVLPAFDGDEPYWRAVPLSVIIKGDWKLIYYYEYDSYELFNLKEDISELNDLSEIEKDKADELLKELRDWTEETNAPIPGILNAIYNIFEDSYEIQKE